MSIKIRKRGKTMTCRIEGGGSPLGDYISRLQELSNSIKPQAENTDDLLNAARVTNEMLKIALANGDKQRAFAYQSDLNRIKTDLANNSLFFDGNSIQQTYERDSSYMMQLLNASSYIKPQAKSMADLRNAAKVKQEMIDFALSRGDVEMAKILQEELNRINSDILRAESER